VVATCQPGDQAQLLSTTPTKPYKLGTEHAGPAATATATFVHGNKSVLMAITCAGGVPTATVTDQG
jgi:serine/threonine-protein kinase